MKASDVKRIIQQFAKQEFLLYPDSFLSEKESVVTCDTDNMSQWAINMWEGRTDEEVERDFKLGLHVDNYIIWTFEEFKKIFPSK